MFREKDYSQEILILNLPLIIFMTSLLFIIFSRRLISAPAEWGILANILFFLSLLFSFLSLIYLIYWVIKIFRIKKINDK